MAENDDTAQRQQEKIKEDEDAFFEELDLDMIDEGVTTNNTTMIDKYQWTNSSS